MSVLLKWDNVEAFKQHLEEMRLFRKSHPSESALRACNYINMPALYVQDFLPETGGTNRAIDKEGWLRLIPLQKVKRWDSPGTDV